jgi:hypothetical protein
VTILLASIVVSRYILGIGKAIKQTLNRRMTMTNLISYRFKVVATKADGATTEAKFHGKYDSDAQAELMARDAASDIEGAQGVYISRGDVEWYISA